MKAAEESFIDRAIRFPTDENVQEVLDTYSCNGCKVPVEQVVERLFDTAFAEGADRKLREALTSIVLYRHESWDWAGTEYYLEKLGSIDTDESVKELLRVTEVLKAREREYSQPCYRSAGMITALNKALDLSKNYMEVNSVGAPLKGLKEAAERLAFQLVEPRGLLNTIKTIREPHPYFSEPEKHAFIIDYYRALERLDNSGLFPEHSFSEYFLTTAQSLGNALQNLEQAERDCNAQYESITNAPPDDDRLDWLCRMP